MEIKKAKDIIPAAYSKCHEGEGTLMCKNLLSGFDKEILSFMHSDDMPAGVSIGLHTHTDNEEVYYLVSGRGILTYDDRTYEMKAGDISLCSKGHSHAFEAVDNCVLIVVGTQNKENIK